MWLLHETFWACVRDPALNPTVIVRRGNEEDVPPSLAVLCRVAEGSLSSIRMKIDTLLSLSSIRIFSLSAALE